MQRAKIDMSETSIVALILTFNEEDLIGACIESSMQIASRVIVVDSHSTDRTVELARLAGTEVVINQFVSHANQINWALRSLPIDEGWVIRIDADERIYPKLAGSIKRIISGSTKDIMAVEISRRTVFMGKLLRFGGTFPINILRVWRSGAAQCEDRLMDEHMVVSHGRRS